MDFSCSSGSMTIECSSFVSQKSPYPKCVDGHHFNYAVEVTLPDESCSALGDVIGSAGDSFIIVERLPLLAFTDQSFVRNIIRNEFISALSIGVQMNGGDVVALLPSGILVLSLTRDTFQALGLNGRASQLGHSRKTSKYIVEINLKHEDFRPGISFYERVKKSFDTHRQLAFTFAVNCNKKFEPSLLDHLRPHTCRIRSLAHSSQTHRRILVPDIDRSRCHSAESSDEEEAGIQAFAFHEWLGAVACQCKLSETDEYISSYVCPSPSQVLPVVCHERWEGLISAATVEQTLHALRNLVTGDAARVAWGAITVHGFIDSPFTHGTGHCGWPSIGSEDLYTIVVFHDDSYRLYRANGPGTD